MKILFINAVDFSVEVESRYPSLGPAYLAAVLRARFGASEFRFRIIDRDIETYLTSFRPDLVCISAVSQNYGLACKYAATVKKYGITVFTGGVHLSALPQTLSEDMDVGCIGEGEMTLTELVAVLLKNGVPVPDDLASINGIVYRNSGELRLTARREPVANLDDLPFPARDLLNIGAHSYLFTSRGCPYRCTFCSSSRFWGKTRYFSAEYVVKEIEELTENYGVKMISFFDDLFIGNRRRLQRIVELIEGNQRLEKVTFTCSGRANMITDDTVSLLKRMRIRSVGMGLESGCEKTLTYLKVDDISVQQNRDAVLRLERGGIAANASFVIGAPDETEEEIMQTYRFIKDVPVALFDVYVLVPYPGTPLWEYALASGVVSESMDWSILNVNFYRNGRKTVLLSKIFDRKRMRRIYGKFMRLRFLHNMITVWKTPQMHDVLSYMVNKITETVHGCKSRRTGK